jgi:hypothetical protein
MGCALENLMLAAAAHGYQATATLLPGKLGPIPAESKPELLARVKRRWENRRCGLARLAKSWVTPHKPVQSRAVDQ